MLLCVSCILLHFHGMDDMLVLPYVSEDMIFIVEKSWFTGIMHSPHSNFSKKESLSSWTMRKGQCFSSFSLLLKVFGEQKETWKRLIVIIIWSLDGIRSQHANAFGRKNAENNNDDDDEDSWLTPFSRGTKVRNSVITHPMVWRVIPEKRPAESEPGLHLCFLDSNNIGIKIWIQRSKYYTALQKN